MLDVEALFPRLRPAGFRTTSPPTDSYNCIAWAAGQTTGWWWPGDPDKTHWPAGVAREETLDAFELALGALGYSRCEGDALEPGFERIALFADTDGAPTHAAKQLTSGLWTSKLGRMEDIEHDLHDLTGPAYGAVVLIMKRPTQGQSATLPS